MTEFAKKICDIQAEMKKLKEEEKRLLEEEKLSKKNKQAEDFETVKQAVKTYNEKYNASYRLVESTLRSNTDELLNYFNRDIDESLNFIKQVVAEL